MTGWTLVKTFPHSSYTFRADSAVNFLEPYFRERCYQISKHSKPTFHTTLFLVSFLAILPFPPYSYNRYAATRNLVLSATTSPTSRTCDAISPASRHWFSAMPSADLPSTTRAAAFRSAAREKYGERYPPTSRRFAHWKFEPATTPSISFEASLDTVLSFDTYASSRRMYVVHLWLPYLLTLTVSYRTSNIIC